MRYLLPKYPSSLKEIIRLRKLPLMLASLWLASCSSLPTALEADADQQTTTKKETQESTPIENYKPFDLQTLYSLLVADIAAQRKRYDITLRNYLRQAIDTNDAGIAHHTTQLAEALRAENIALKSSKLWAQSAPSNPKALQSSAIHLAKARQFDQALLTMAGALELGGETNFTLIASFAVDKATKNTQAQQQSILAEFQSLNSRYPNNIDLLLGQAGLQQKLGLYEDALTSTHSLLAIHSNAADQAINIPALTAEAQILLQLNRDNEAFSRFQEALEQDPDNKRLRLQYARLLTRPNMGEAEKQFEILVANSPNDYELLFTLALVYRENQQLDKATATLQRILLQDPNNSPSYYYLGLIAEEEGDIESAISYYSSVSSGQTLLPAKARYAELASRQGDVDQVITELSTLAASHKELAVDFQMISANTLTNSGRLDQSHHVLTQAIKEHPSNQALLYARSMLNEKRLDLVGMEQDLRNVLSLDPNNATALNALGYTLTIHTNRFSEALDLIRRALEINPEDPATMDSMGWVQFRLGNLEQALIFLRKAHNLFPDPEVAAHFGEVLWTSGDQTQATTIWQEALKSEPNNTILKSTIERFSEH